MVAVNSTFILEPIPNRSTPIICSDGLWGAFKWTHHPQLYHDSTPHLAFIQLPINGDEWDILLHPVSKDASWRPSTGQSVDSVTMCFQRCRLWHCVLRSLTRLSTEPDTAFLVRGMAFVH